MNDVATHPELSAGSSATARRPLAVRSAGLTHRGQVRPANEDNFLIAELAKAMHIQQSSIDAGGMRYSSERGYLFLVADGMGGHRAGEQASSLTLEVIEHFVLDTLKWFFHLQSGEERNLLAEFQAALHQADSTVLAEADRHPECHGMGTTLTMAYCLAGELFVVHVGDSRCYLLRDGKLHRLTHDHTLTEEMVRRGLLKQAEAAHHPYRHVITNCVGGNSPGLQPEARKMDLEPGDTLLLCSDGLTEMVPEGKVEAVLLTTPDPRKACERLVAMANEAGGRDNVTAIVARFDSADQAGDK
jgi:protein phosphatase